MKHSEYKRPTGRPFFLMLTLVVIIGAVVAIGFLFISGAFNGASTTTASNYVYLTTCHATTLTQTVGILELQSTTFLACTKVTFSTTTLQKVYYTSTHVIGVNATG